MLGEPRRQTPPRRPAPTQWPAYDVERRSVRVVLQDHGGRVLLLRTIDPTMPETGTWWELPGGGVEDGESVSATALREVAEETGLVLRADLVGPPRWSRSATYLRRGVRTVQHEVVVVAQVPQDAPEPSRDGRTAEELEDYVGHVWWSPAEVAEAAGRGARFFPGRLPELLAPCLAGADIDEPFELWN